MAVDYRFKKGIDSPTWQWMSFFQQGASYNGTSNVYDGVRYMYWVVQYGTTTSGTVSSSQLWRFDTWTNGWQYLAPITNGANGMDIEYDGTRNVLYIMNGTSTTWQIFNLNATSVVIANTTCAAFALTTASVVLPAVPGNGASITLPNDIDVAAQIDTGIADSTGNTTTNITATKATGSFGVGMLGLQVRVTSGAQAGQKRVITGVTNAANLTVSPALNAALVSGDTFVIEVVQDTATAGTTTTLTGPANATWTTNRYANHDVLITSGTGAGQRRRIASNTANVLTLAAAVTGSATATGSFTTAPDATSVFKILPSNDFLYMQTAAAFYKIDLAQTTGIAWVTLTAPPGAFGGGANTFYPGAYSPYGVLGVRGAATANVYQYDIGTNAWSTYVTWWASENINTGASVCMLSGKRKLFIQKEGQARCYVHDLLTGMLEPSGVMPYANPSAYDGKRARYVKTPDGVEWLYILRAGGQEFYRMPLEWL